jgi:AraC-like DNA-binding protein
LIVSDRREPDSLSAFNAAFRDLTGRTPTQYRATFRP